MIRHFFGTRGGAIGTGHQSQVGTPQENQKINCAAGWQSRFSGSRKILEDRVSNPEEGRLHQIMSSELGCETSLCQQNGWQLEVE